MKVLNKYFIYLSIGLNCSISFLALHYLIVKMLNHPIPKLSFVLTLMHLVLFVIMMQGVKEFEIEKISKFLDSVCR